MKFLIVISCIALCGAQNLEIQPEPISPYSFSYTADATDGGSARQESADINGVVRGSYSLVSADGSKRIVNYIADENGFRASVNTNEPGTESKSAADVIMQSSQLPAEEIALKVGPRPDEKPEVFQTFGVKGVEHKLLSSPIVKSPKAFLLSRPLETLLKPQVLEIPALKKFELPLERTFIPSHLQLKKIETPIKLLSKIPKTQSFKTFGLDLQKEDFVSQNYERF